VQHSSQALRAAHQLVAMSHRRSAIRDRLRRRDLVVTSHDGFGAGNGQSSAAEGSGSAVFGRADSTPLVQPLSRHRGCVVKCTLSSLRRLMRTSVPRFHLFATRGTLFFSLGRQHTVTRCLLLLLVRGSARATSFSPPRRRTNEDNEVCCMGIKCTQPSIITHASRHGCLSFVSSKR
jgi:hypothetical protein